MHVECSLAGVDLALVCVCSCVWQLSTFCTSACLRWGWMNLENRPECSFGCSFQWRRVELTLSLLNPFLKYWTKQCLTVLSYFLPVCQTSVLLAELYVMRHQDRVSFPCTRVSAPTHASAFPRFQSRQRFYEVAGSQEQRSGYWHTNQHVRPPTAFHNADRPGAATTRSFLSWREV